MNLLVTVGGGSVGTNLAEGQGTAIVGRTSTDPAVKATTTSEGVGAYLTVDHLGRVVNAPYGPPESRVRGTIQENAFAIGGTAVLIAAPGAGLVTVLYSVQFGDLTVDSVITLESPIGTVLWAGLLESVDNYGGFSMPGGLAGANNGAWIVRASIATVMSINAQGYTERA